MSESIACDMRVAGEVSTRTRDVARERYCMGTIKQGDTTFTSQVTGYQTHVIEKAIRLLFFCS